MYQAMGASGAWGGGGRSSSGLKKHWEAPGRHEEPAIHWIHRDHPNREDTARRCTAPLRLEKRALSKRALSSDSQENAELNEAKYSSSTRRLLQERVDVQ
jgi:hypothetical protein